MNITATSESKAQVIAEFKSIYGDWYSAIRLVGWISQDRVNAKTTLFTKWQRDQYNYWPYNDDSHQYKVTFGGEELKKSFAFPQSKTNGVADLTALQKVTVQHTNGEYTGNLTASGVFETSSSSHAWGNVSQTVSITFPTITVITPDPTDTDEPAVDPPAEIVDDTSSFFYIYCDKHLLYAANVPDYSLINPKLTLEISRAGSLEFTVPVTAEMYDQIHLLKSTIDVRMGNTVIWRGRPLKPQRDILNNKRWTCEGFMSWLSDRQLLPYKWPEEGSSNKSASDLFKKFLSRYNSRATDDRKIVFKYSDFAGNVTVEQKNHSDAWKEIDDIFIKNLGAFVVPYITQTETGVMLRSAYGSVSTQVIQFGTNLVDYDDYIDGTQIFTAVRPFGKEVNGSRIGLTGSSFIVNDAAVERYGRIEKTVFFDEITTEAALRKAATEYLNEGIQEALSITIKAVDLHLLNVNINRIKVGDWVRVVSVPHGLDSYFLCSKIVYDLAHPKNNVYTFGATQSTISQMTEVGRNKYVITEGA